MAMDSPVERLMDFELENFINTYRSELCSRTLNQNQIATFLQFDYDQIQKIDQSPNTYAKNERLYDLISQTSKGKDFLAALEPTGNKHLIPMIQQAMQKSRTSGKIPSSSSSVNKMTGIWFNLPEPIDSFCGREDFLRQLHEKLQGVQERGTPEVTVLSQVKIVSGLGGIGKTQTARRYIMKNQQFYNNFIWIDAESESSTRNSFIKLANELQIPLQTSKGKSRDMEEIVKKIYNKICEGGKSNLIIFDNAEDYKSCHNFFPFGLHPDLKKPVILATSRNQEWKSATGKIQVLPLDVLTEDESLEFILKQLEMEDSPEFREESREFIQLIGGLPLALQQALAYIKQQKKDNQLFGRPYKMNDYVKSSRQKFQSFSPVPARDSSPTLYVTWNVTFEKLQKLENGEKAIKILKLLSFLYAHKIPLSFLRKLIPETAERDFVQGLKLLEKYSLVRILNGGSCVSIHPQLQFVILESLKERNEISKVLLNLVEKCLSILQTTKLVEGDDALLNILQLVSFSFNFCHFPKTNSPFSRYRSRYCSEGDEESFGLYKKVYSKCQEIMGEEVRTLLKPNHLVNLMTESAIKDKIQSSLSYLCANTVNAVQFAMNLLDSQLIGTSKFNDVMSLEEDDFTLFYFLYEEVLKLDSLQSLQNALAALNACGNDHIVMYILFGKVGERPKRQSNASTCSTKSSSSSSVDKPIFSKVNQEEDDETYGCKNVRVLFINNRFDGSQENYSGEYRRMKREAAHMDDFYITDLFEKTLRMKVDRKENVSSVEIGSIMHKFTTDCNKWEHDGSIVIISTHGAGLHSLLMDDLTSINAERDVIQHFSSRKFPEFDGKPKLFLFNAGRRGHSGRSVVPELPKSSDKESLHFQYADILIGYSTLPFNVSYRSQEEGSIYIKFIHDICIENIGKKWEIRKLLNKVGKKVAEATASRGSAQVPEILDRLFNKDFYLTIQHD